MAWVLFAITSYPYLFVCLRMSSMVVGMIYCYQELRFCFMWLESVTKVSGPATATAFITHSSLLSSVLYEISLH